MKFIISTLSVAAVLCALIANHGFEIDFPVVLSVGFTGAVVSLFLRDYRRKPDCYENLFVEKTVRRAQVVKPQDAGVEFATFATFHTMIG